MRIGRGIIIPAILALGLAGSVLGGLEMSLVAAQAPSAHVQVAATSGNPNILYRN
jgi:hypothetical protein